MPKITKDLDVARRESTAKNIILEVLFGMRWQGGQDAFPQKQKSNMSASERELEIKEHASLDKK